MEKGIDVKDLINSRVFCFTFDYDEWHSTSADPGRYIRPYNGSFFDLRSAYTTVFPEEQCEISHADSEAVESTEPAKLYKVKYSINFLPTIGRYAVRDAADGSISI